MASRVHPANLGGNVVVPPLVLVGVTVTAD
jgi:hypothetical protein